MATAHYSAVGEDEEGYFASMTDVVIGLLFVFIIMLMFFAMRFQEATQKQDIVTEKQTTLIEDLTDAELTRNNILQGIGTYLQSQGIDVIIVKDEGLLAVSRRYSFRQIKLGAKKSWRFKRSEFVS